MSVFARTLRKLVRRLADATRVRLPTDPIPSAWPELVARHVPLIARLPAADQDRLYRLMQLFLKEVPLEPCAGLALTDAMRVTIAAQACLLLLKLPYPRYHRARRVLVYPADFVPRTVRLPQSGELVTPDAPAAGQAWHSGVVILAWDSARQGALAADDGHNTVLHEFAHLLDAEDGAFDGVPLLDSESEYRTWAAVLAEHFAAHGQRTEAGEATVLDPYGAQNRAEFFAVATETFFERPIELRRDQPRLYALLVGFFKLDPAALLQPADGTGAA